MLNFQTFEPSNFPTFQRSNLLAEDGPQAFGGEEHNVLIVSDRCDARRYEGHVVLVVHPAPQLFSATVVRNDGSVVVLGHKGIARIIARHAVAVAGNALAYGPLGLWREVGRETLHPLVAYVGHIERAVFGLPHSGRLDK